MDGELKTAKRRQWRKWMWLLTSMGLFAMLVVIGFWVDAARDWAPERFEAVLQLKFPTQSKIVDLYRNTAGFDGSKSWLVDFGSAAPRGWESSPQFHECPFNELRGDDYEFIRSHKCPVID